MGPGPLGPGWLERPDLNLFGLHLLQWGRGLSAPDGGLRSTRPCVGGLASMGPGPLGPGWLLREERTVQRWLALQWGRGLSAPDG